jgi:hypothetical protein
MNLTEWKKEKLDMEKKLFINGTEYEAGGVLQREDLVWILGLIDRECGTASNADELLSNGEINAAEFGINCNAVSGRESIQGEVKCSHGDGLVVVNAYNEGAETCCRGGVYAVKDSEGNSGAYGSIVFINIDNGSRRGITVFSTKGE